MVFHGMPSRVISPQAWMLMTVMLHAPLGMARMLLVNIDQVEFCNQPWGSLSTGSISLKWRMRAGFASIA